MIAWVVIGVLVNGMVLVLIFNKRNFLLRDIFVSATVAALCAIGLSFIITPIVFPPVTLPITVTALEQQNVEALGQEIRIKYVEVDGKRYAPRNIFKSGWYIEDNKLVWNKYAGSFDISINGDVPVGSSISVILESNKWRGLAEIKIGDSPSKVVDAFDAGEESKDLVVSTNFPGYVADISKARQQQGVCLASLFAVLFIAIIVFLSQINKCYMAVVNLKRAALKTRAALKNIFNYFPLLAELVGRDLKKKYRRSILGYVWSLLNPLMMMVIVAAVFSYIFRNNIENFPIYLIIGQTFYAFFSGATSQAMESLSVNSSLLSKVYIPKVIFPFASVIFEFVNLLYSLIAIVAVVVFTGAKITPTIVLFPVGLLYITMFCLGVGLILSIAAVYFGDIIHLYKIVLTAWMYLTPIFYSADQLAPWMKNVIIFNPLYHYINYFRMIILWDTVPNLKTNLACFGFGAALIVLGLIFFKRNQDNIIYHI